MQYFLSVLLYHSTNYKLEQQFCTIATIARVSRKIEKNIFQFFFLAIDFNKKNAKYSLLTFHYPDKWDIYILPKLYIACLIYIYWKTFSTDVSIEYRSSLDIWLPYILFLKFHRFFFSSQHDKKVDNLRNVYVLHALFTDKIDKQETVSGAPHFDIFNLVS